MGRARMCVSVAACVVLGIGTVVSAVALRVGVDSHGAAGNQADKNGSPRSISAGTMQGNLIKKVAPKYPSKAKTARIQGTVELDAVIDENGRIDSLKVLSGPAELQKSSLDAVRHWRYKPFLLNGEAIEVETTINVVYTLEN